MSDHDPPELQLIEVEEEKTEHEKLMEAYERLGFKIDNVKTRIQKRRNSKLS